MTTSIPLRTVTRSSSGPSKSAATTSIPRLLSPSVAGLKRDAGLIRALISYKMLAYTLNNFWRLTKLPAAMSPSRIERPVSPVAPTRATRVVVMAEKSVTAEDLWYRLKIPITNLYLSAFLFPRSSLSQCRDESCTRWPYGMRIVPSIRMSVPVTEPLLLHIFFDYKFGDFPSLLRAYICPSGTA
jgi:hypothetical protein